MRRVTLDPRSDWQAKVEEHGLIWHTADDKPYWQEGACYSFRPDHVAQIGAATTELYGLFIEAGDHIVSHDLYAAFGIPDFAAPLVREAWEDEPPALNFGRFDLGFDGSSAPKLFEFQCDTPTALVEAAIVQWAWREDVFPQLDQFNSIDDALVARWREIELRLGGGLVHFTHVREPSGEDAVTCAYLADTAERAGLQARPIVIEDIGYDPRRTAFVDLQDEPIRNLFKLYPWEWLLTDPFALQIPGARTQWLEPIWKMIWSNKAILPILWELFPDHPNLLRASFDQPTGFDVDYVAKPILGREGANITLFRRGQAVDGRPGTYGGPFVYQELYELPEFDGRYPVIGSWVVDGAAVGIGIREDGRITGNTAQFVPHVIEENPA